MKQTIVTISRQRQALCAFLLFLLMAAGTRGATIYVDCFVTNSTSSGSSWGNAYSNLQTALNSAASGDSLWVAQGSYNAHPTNTTFSFSLRSNVSLYGGFAGIETSTDQRDWRLHPTVLDGDINVRGNSRDNTRQIVVASGVTNVVFDGFRVTGGNGGTNHLLNTALGTVNGSGLSILSQPITVQNCFFDNNDCGRDGAAIYADQSASTIRNCIFSNNVASLNGGAVRSRRGTPVLENCVFVNNRTSGAAGNGGALAVSEQSVTIRHCTFLGNQTTALGNSMYVYNQGTAQVRNSIYWNENGASDHGGGIHVKQSGTATTHALLVDVRDSVVKNGLSSPLYTTSTNVVTLDPLFVAETNRNVHLQELSPCIDAGDSAQGVGSDLDGILRPEGAGYDLGAYEYTTNTPSVFPSVSGLAATGGVGRVLLTWTNPIPSTFQGVLIVRTAGGVSLAGSPPTGVSYAVGSRVVNGVAVYVGPGQNGSPGVESGFIHTNMPPSSTNLFTVFAYDQQTNYSYAVAILGVSAGRPPAPSGLSALGLKNAIQLSWTNPNAMDLQGLLVLRRKDFAPTGTPADGAVYTNGSMIGTGEVVYQGWGSNTNGGSGSVWTNTGLAGSTMYQYVLYAVDTGPNYSRPTSAASATTLSLQNISGLSALPTDHACHFSWTNPVDSEYAGVLVLREPLNNAAKPVMWLQFADGAGTTASDSSGHANDGTLLANASLVPGGGPTLSGTGGTLDAVSFAGSASADNAVRIPDSTSLDFDKSRGTIMFWVNPSEAKERYCFVKTDPFDSATGVEVAKNATGLFGWPRGFSGACFASVPLQVSQWQHVAYTWDAGAGTNMNLFIDGERDAGATGAAPFLPTTTGDWILGQDYDDGGNLYDRYFVGSMADFAVFATALDAGTIATIYSNSIENVEAVAEPLRGVVYTNGQMLGNATVVYAGPGNSTTPGGPSGWTDPGLLQASTEYLYRFFAFDSALGYAEAPDIQTNVMTLADVTPPNSVTNLYASIAGIGQIDLDWGNPTSIDFSGVLIVRKTDPPPAWSPTPGATYSFGSSTPAGTVVYAGPGNNGTPGANNAFLDLYNLNAGQRYYYTVFAYDSASLYSSSQQADAESPPADVLFVNDDAVAGANNGVSWLNAYTNLQDALAAATASNQIWVAEGTYYPTDGTSTAAKFTLDKPIAIYGGFAGNESKLLQRKYALYPTILSGDIGTRDANFDNSAQILTTTAGAAGGLLDGFIIEKANGTGNGSGMYVGVVMTVQNCWFRDILSGNSALFIQADASIRNCRFSNNVASARGGALQSQSASPTIVNCVFYDNSCDGAGGTLALYHRPMTFVNCTFTASTCPPGAAICVYISNYGAPTFINCIFNDFGDSGGGIFPKPWNGQNESGAVSLYNCFVRGGIALSQYVVVADQVIGGQPGEDPDFVDEGARDLHLLQTSICVDAGTATGAPVDDLDGGTRPVGAGYDIGAYEYGSTGPGTPPSGMIFFVR